MILYPFKLAISENPRTENGYIEIHLFRTILTLLNIIPLKYIYQNKAYFVIVLSK